MSFSFRKLTAAATAAMILLCAPAAFAANTPAQPASIDVPVRSADGQASSGGMPPQGQMPVMSSVSADRPLPPSGDLPPQGPPPDVSSADLAGPRILGITVEGNSQVV